ncbi:MAG: ATP-binding cassette domain-containing protein [Burkholderiales bacterium]|nr:ATP-binding cassette domain-containing protein [Burkholderiales bacterium]
MIRLRSLTLSRGGTALLDRAEATIAPGERIALIGRNGSGKTTLLAALAGELPPDGGDIEQPWREVIRLAQGLPSSTLPAWRYIVAGDARLEAARGALEQAEHDGDGVALALAHDHWQEAGGLTAEARARSLLAGLGFAPAQAEQPVDTLSGGWRMRLNLARALFAHSELLLLDEPTNHLDLDAILWLERWLLRYPGTAVIVSHDRDFLDRVAVATLHIDEGKLVRYAGGYSAFERLRAQRRQQAERARAAYDTRVAHLNAFITRFRAKATKARQAQSRLKALERMAEVAPVRALRGIEFSLHEVGDCPDPLLTAQELDAGYPGHPVLRGVELAVRRGARIGILGRNGAGKSTLVRTLVGELAPLAGEVRVSRSVRIGYFAQQGIERLRGDESALAQLQRCAPALREQALRDYLGRFGFSGEDATRPVGPMSGGEKARLALALMLHERPQLLVLDEPTNHLDAQARDALADALAEFDGAMLLVSHDRYLLRATVDTLMLVAGGRLATFDGDLDDYAAWLAQQAGSAAAGTGSTAAAGLTTAGRAAAALPAQPASGEPSSVRPAPAPAAGGHAARQERRLAAQRRAELARQLAPLDREILAVEARLSEVDLRLAALERQLADPGLYRDAAGAATVARERAALAGEKEALEERWLEHSAAREAQREAFEREAFDRTP